MSVDVDKLVIVNYPHPVLRQKAAPIEQITDQVRVVAKRMLQLMHEAPGIGLAAPQVGLPWRMFVASDSGQAEDDRVFINPRLVEPAEETEAIDEGCLSLPGINVKVRRPTGISIEATDLEGNDFRLSSDELAARVWQHEYDHLDGVLIIDRMSPIDKLANRKAIKLLEAQT